MVTCLERAGLLALLCVVFLCFCYFPMWCSVSGVVVDCIDFWSLPSFLLCEDCVPWWLFRFAKEKHWGNSGRGYYGEHSFEITSNLDR